jgi:SAM-dependent methyltransferase
MDEQHTIWEDWAQADPLWAILSDPTRKGGRWELDEFFASGDHDVEEALRECAEHGLALARGRALDFGCGVGRLTQALASHFDHVDGVDISETMVRLANEHNRWPDRVQYHVNTTDDLGLLDDESFDFVLTVIVLQHNPPAVARRYIAEFVRILRPGGIAVFDLTSTLANVSLPAGAHQGALELLDAPSTLAPGESAIAKVRVTNTSGVDWPPASRLALGNHWLRGDGAMAVQDDGRTPLGDGLATQASTEAELTVTAPKAPNRYRLAVDLVEEGVTWFSGDGGALAERAVEVRRPRRFLRRGRDHDASASTPDHEPRPFEMNGVPREDVEATVAEAGAQIVAAIPSGRGGAHWDGFRYFVAKPR